MGAVRKRVIDAIRYRPASLSQKSLGTPLWRRIIWPATATTSNTRVYVDGHVRAYQGRPEDRQDPCRPVEVPRPGHRGNLGVRPWRLLRGGVDEPVQPFGSVGANP